DRLWLTYRLFQWLSLQFDRMPRDARILGLRALREAAPPPKGLPPDADLLDPFRFDRARFDHRLASVLYAFSLMEGLPSMFSMTAKEKPVSVSSPELEKRLAELAGRSLSKEERALRYSAEPSCLGWAGLSAIPDLALYTLLGLNTEALFQIMP